MKKKTYDNDLLHELVYQALETELAGVRIYETAVTCAVDQRLKVEWQKSLAETTRHLNVLLGVFTELGLDRTKATRARESVDSVATSLVRAMLAAKSDGDMGDAQVVASQCVAFAGTKDDLNWGLLGNLVARHEESRTRRSGPVRNLARTSGVSVGVPVAHAAS